MCSLRSQSAHIKRSSGICLSCVTVAFAFVSPLRAQTPPAGSFAATHAALRSKISQLDEEITHLQRSERNINPKTNRSAGDMEKRVREAETAAAECRELQKAANETAAGWKPIGAQVESAEQAAGETRQSAASIQPSLDRVDRLAAQLSQRDQASQIVQRFQAAQATVKRGGERLAEARRLNSQAKEAFLADKQSAETYTTAQRLIDERIRTLKSNSFAIQLSIESIESYEAGRARAQRSVDDLVAKLQQLQTSVRGKDANSEQEVAATLADARTLRDPHLPSYAAKLHKLQADRETINKARASIETDAAGLRERRAKQTKFADEAVDAAENAQAEAETRLAASQSAYEKALEFLRRNPETGVVPNVVGMSAAEACQTVLQAKLTPGTEFVRTGIPAGRTGTVFEQSLPAGVRTPEGTNVILKIYGTVVPSVLGWRVPTAGDILGEVGLSLDKVTSDRPAPSEQQAERIYWQDPPAGAPIRPDRKLVDVRAYAPWNSTPMPPPSTVEVGFQPGDGALIDPRFAAAAVTDGSHPDAKMSSGGPGSELSYVENRMGREQFDLAHLMIHRFPTADELGQYCSGMRQHYRSLTKDETSQTGGTKAQLVRDTPTEFHFESTIRFEPTRPPLKAWFDKQSHRFAVYRGEFLVVTGRLIKSESPIAANPSEAADRIIENSKKLIDLRFPQK